MSDKIKILDESVTNVIAAGEVVENPASMVKELVENCLDAKAKNIKIFISNSGRNVKISDDGKGMSKNDLFLSIERHATSKIETKNDIFNIKTLGFRGEALASIASVSEMTIVSCNNNENRGNSLFIKGGKIFKAKSCAKNRGTEIDIKKLFFNTPARLKFLKTKNTEYGKIKDIILKEALSNYDVSFNLYLDGKPSINTSGNGIENCILELFGKNVLKNLIPFKYGFLGKIDILKASKKNIYTYFNKRYARSRLVEKAIIDSYYTKLPKGKYPFVILFFEIPPNEIDVNIHPSKKVVKFTDERKIYDIISGSIKEKFVEKEKESLPEIRIDDKFETKEEKTEIELFNTNNSKKNYEYENDNHIIKEENVVNEKPNIDYGKNTDEKKETSKDKIEDFIIIGQFKNTYIIVETDEGLEIYDQHIVHERILYEELKEKYYNKNISKKLLLIPEKITLDMKEKDAIENNIDILNEFGFEIENFGEREYLIRKIPDFEFKESIRDVIFDILNKLINEDLVKDIREKLLIEMSCKGAIKKNQKLGFNEMKRLLIKLKELGKYTCPHGRPIILKLSLFELEKKFKRK